MSLAVTLFRNDRNCVLLIVALGLLLFATGLGNHDLWAPDEPDLGEVVREIHLTGSWAALRDNEHLYFEKPPLFPWLAALLAWPAGRPSELTLRLPSSLAALCGLIVVFYLGRDLFGRRPGALAAIVLATMYGYFMEARWAHPDMLWTFWLTLACFAFARAYRERGRVLWLAVFYFAIGLANLTKGPHGLLIPLLAVLLFLAATRDLGFVKRMGLAWGIPLALVPAAFWVAAFRSTGESFPLEALLARLAHRFTTGEHHAQPFYHVLISIPIESFPWVLLLPAALIHTFPRRGARPDWENAYVYSWLFLIVAVFGLSVEKRGVYLLPLLPLLALLIGRLWDMALMEWDPSPADRPVAWMLGLVLVGSLGGAAYVLPRLRHEAPDLVRSAAVVAAAAFVSAVMSLIVRRRRRAGAALGAFSAGLAVTYLLVTVVVLPALDPHKSSRAFSLRAAATAGTAPLAMYPDYRPTYVYYSGRFIPVLKTPAELRAHFTSGTRAYVLIEDNVLEAERRGLDIPLEILDRQRVGHREMLLVAGGGPGPRAEDGSSSP